MVIAEAMATGRPIVTGRIRFGLSYMAFDNCLYLQRPGSTAGRYAADLILRCAGECPWGAVHLHFDSEEMLSPENSCNYMKSQPVGLGKLQVPRFAFSRV
jgi:hypothetical protein